MMLKDIDLNKNSHLARLYESTGKPIFLIFDE